MTYNSFLYLNRTLAHYIQIYPTGMTNKQFLITYGIARNTTEAQHIKSVIRCYLRNECTLNRAILSIIYLHYKQQDICLENAMGYKMHMSWIIKEYAFIPPDKKVIKSHDAIGAIEKFMYDI